MIFNSVHFLLFFPIVTVIYFIIPKKIRWVWLLISSYYFYMCWNPKYVILIAVSTVLTYLSGLLISRENKTGKHLGRKKLWVALSFLLNFAILIFFKYWGFFADNIIAIGEMAGVAVNIPRFDILLPVGISFYTFQALSYTMDVYRGEIYAEKNLFKYALFVSFFPQLVAGPIERSKNLLTQVNQEHSFDPDRARNGLLLMLWGFFQKVVIADRIAVLVDYVYDNHTGMSGSAILLATLLFAVQIYCDFGGYSDIAIGAAQILGFDLMQNFRQPYLATSASGFWRRWHISLSTWFRDYLYIPLGGNRKGKLRKYINVMITFFVSGLWHGASWTYVIWGGLNGFYQVVGEILKPIREKIKSVFHIKNGTKLLRAFQILFTFILIDFAWMFFRAPSIGAATEMIAQMFTGFNLEALSAVTEEGIRGLYTLGLSRPEFWVGIAAITVLIIADFIKEKRAIRPIITKMPLVPRWAFYLVAVFVILIFGAYGPGYDSAAFIYFQF